jgi:enoyl-CoA hydratase/carnithine racemase
MSVTFELVPAGKSHLGIATLNVEKSLNALTIGMIEELYAQLSDWKTNPEVCGVLIRGQGRAFCAGGDIRALNESLKASDSNIQKFFEKEYQLDASLYSYPKSIIVWAHGITMGGGMGIMQGAKFRIVTDSTRLAMPEITIGLFPDVGASFFLKKVPKSWGLFLALTGARIKASEAVQLNLADYWLGEVEQAKFLENLTKMNINCPTTFHKEVEKYFSTQKQTCEEGEIFAHGSFVEQLLKNTNEKSLINWASTYSPKDEWEKALIHSVQVACPTSLGLIYALWERSKNWSVEESFYNEWFVASQCGRKGNFAEGVRALLIDKDNKPKWNPPTVNDLTAEHIESHFISPRADGKNPLEFLLKK